MLDDALTGESCVRLSERVDQALREHGFSDRSATQAALFTEEIGLTLIERDSGIIFDVTDPELKIDGLSSFVINGLLTAQKEKVYLTTTGYNRNMIRFSKT